MVGWNNSIYRGEIPTGLPIYKAIFTGHIHNFSIVSEGPILKDVLRISDAKEMPFLWFLSSKNATKILCQNTILY